MIKLVSTLAASSLVLAGSVFAQERPATPSAPAERIEVPPAASPSASPSTSPSASPSATAVPASDAMIMTEAQAKNWVNKVVYSSDNKNLGEIAAVARDNSGKVTEIHLDIGGFLGLGETRVRAMPSEFKFLSDRVMLNITADQAKELPRLAK